MKASLAVCIVLSAIPVSFFSDTIALAETSEMPCFDGNSLVAASDAELISGMPCNQMGALFIFGLGLDHPRVHEFAFLPFEGNKASAHYPMVRSYLDHRNQGTDTPIFEVFASLIEGVTLLGAVSGEDDPRARIYATFLLGEYWGEFIPDDSSALLTTVPTMHLLMSGLGLANLREVSCFVLSDYPTVSVETVMSSARFEACVATDLD